MKASVDSKEFSKAVRGAGKYTKTTGLTISEGVLLKVEENSLFIRTTTGSEDCIIRVNAFDPIEDGQVVTLASVLIPASVDSGDLMEVSTDGNKLLLDYGNFDFRLGTLDSTEEDFPTLVEADLIASLDIDKLKIACASTTPFDKTGMPTKSSVHLVQHGDGIAIVGTDGFIGYMSVVEGEIDSLVSIDAQMLTKALSVVGDFVTVHAKDGRVIVAGSIGTVSFSSMVCPPIDNIVDGFSYVPDHGPIIVPAEEMRLIANLCHSATGVYIGSEIKIDGNDVKIVGVNVDITSSISTEIPYSVFRCNEFARMIGTLDMDESVEVYVKMLPSGSSHFWYVDTEDRHFVYSVTPKIIVDETGNAE